MLHNKGTIEVQYMYEQVRYKHNAGTIQVQYRYGTASIQVWYRYSAYWTVEHRAGFLWLLSATDWISQSIDWLSDILCCLTIAS